MEHRGRYIYVFLIISNESATNRFCLRHLIIQQLYSIHFLSVGCAFPFMQIFLTAPLTKSLDPLLATHPTGMLSCRVWCLSNQSYERSFYGTLFSREKNTKDFGHSKDKYWHVSFKHVYWSFLVKLNDVFSNKKRKVGKVAVQNHTIELFITSMSVCFVSWSLLKASSTWLLQEGAGIGEEASEPEGDTGSMLAFLLGDIGLFLSDKGDNDLSLW